METPRANRLHISIYGKRNVGKSSLINAITGQNIALVSEVAGTTTDPVFKSMELLPIGPVVFIDTAGLDDEGEIGQLRIKKSKEIMDKTDLALLVFDLYKEDFLLEKEWYNELIEKNIPIVGVINKIDEIDADIQKLQELFPIAFVKVSAKHGQNIEELKNAIFASVPEEFEKKTILGDIIKPKDIVILVAPQDLQAPKGRLILPQVQVIRDILDNDALALTVKDNELQNILDALNKKPALVVTDSQVFGKVNSILSEDIPLTSFSILMARYKGDLKSLVDGARAIDKLIPGDKILIAEACTHHALQGDIAREKLPKWLENKVGGKLDITVNSGIDYPGNLKEFKLIIHCGACMFNRKQLMTRIFKSTREGVPITNFGTAIAHINGILEKTVKIFNV